MSSQALDDSRTSAAACCPNAATREFRDRRKRGQLQGEPFEAAYG
jgi:hypothetical protein